MKIRIIVSTLVIVCMAAVPAFAKIWSIDNNTSNQADFRTLDAAHASVDVKSDDALYVAGSTQSYGSVAVKKKLNIVGPGYFLGDNPDTQANLLDAKFDSITFDIGSEGSSLTGMSGSNIYISTNSITIKRNKLIWIGIGYNRNVSDTIILQNYFSRASTIFDFYNTTNGTIISNNIILAGSYRAFSMNSSSTAIITHNTIQGNLYLFNADFHSNILYSGTVDGKTNCTMKYNICNDDQFGTADGNKTVADMTTVFIGTGSYDGKWQLKNDSPAKGSGFNGADCGAFGGASWYVLSGIPAIPTIYEVNAPGTGSAVSGIPVHVKVKSRN